MKEAEGNFDKARRVLQIVNIASIIAGGLLGLMSLIGGWNSGHAIDQSVKKHHDG